MSFRIYPPPFITLRRPQLGNQDTFDPRIVINRNSYGRVFGVLDTSPPVGYVQNLTFTMFESPAALIDRLMAYNGQLIAYEWDTVYYEGFVLDSDIDFVEDRPNVWTFTVSIHITSVNTLTDMRIVETGEVRLTEDGLMRVVE